MQAQLATIDIAGFHGWGTPLATETGFQATLAEYLRELRPDTLPPNRDRKMGSLTYSGGEYFVKYYRVRKAKARLQSLLHYSQSHKARRYAYQLADYGINTPQVVAHLQRGGLLGRQEHLLITEGVSGQTLRAAIESHRGPAHRRALLRATAEFLARLHEIGVYHGDFSALNIIVQMDAGAAHGWRVYLIDLDAIRSVHYISLRRQIKNLDELGRNFTTLNEVSIQDRLRFLHHYYFSRKRPAHSLRQLKVWVCERTYSRMQAYGKRFVYDNDG
jgi:tRNA A-37 threonylcarbamoyl transferase component Bud32